MSNTNKRNEYIPLQPVGTQLLKVARQYKNHERKQKNGIDKESIFQYEGLLSRCLCILIVSNAMGKIMTIPGGREIVAIAANNTARLIFIFLKKYHAPKVQNRKSPSAYATVVKRKT
jgi:hypothetical protein